MKYTAHATVFGIQGLEPVIKRLSALPEVTQRKVWRTAQRPAVKIIAAEVKQTAPRYKKRRGRKPPKHVIPGQLRRAVKVRAMQRKRGRVGVMVRIGDGDFVGKTFYAAFLEYGTKNYGSRNNKRFLNYGARRGKSGRRRRQYLAATGARIHARKFMWLAFQKRKFQARQLLETNLAKGIDQEVARMAINAGNTQ